MNNRICEVVVPVDGSQVSTVATRYAGYLAFLSGAGLQLLYAMPAGPAELADVPANRRVEADADQNDKRKKAEQAITAARGVLDPPMRQQSKEVVIEDVAHHGDPAAVIVRHVQGRPDCLLVMGARGLGGLKRLFLGSVSDSVLHKVDCPLTVIHEKEHAANKVGLQAILLPVDASRHSDGAARLAGYLARRSGASVHLLFVYPGYSVDISAVHGTMADPGAPEGQTSDAIRKAAHQEARRVFDQARQQLGKLSGQVFEYLHADRSPADAIVAHAEQQASPTMIMMGRRGMGPWGERLLGSVSQAVLAKAPCPVTLVH